MPNRAITLIVNPAAGGLLDESISADDIASRLTAAGYAVELLDGGRNELNRLLERALAAPADLVAVAGGDGTVNAAARALAGSDKVLAVIPAGTLNHLARDLGIPNDIDGAIAALKTGVVTRIDVGEVNGELFLCSSVVGFASRLGGQRERWRGQLNAWTWARLFGRIARTLYRDPRLDVHLSAAAPPKLRSRYLMVSVGTYDEGPGQLLTRSRLDSGRFGVYAVRRPTLVRLVRLFIAILAGRWRRMPDLMSTDALELAVECSRPRLRVMNDGEVAVLDTPLRYRIRPAGLLVVRAATATPDENLTGVAA